MTFAKLFACSIVFAVWAAFAAAGWADGGVWTVVFLALAAAAFALAETERIKQRRK